MEIQEFLRVIRHRWRVVVISVLMCVSIVLAWSLAGPVEYTAQGRVMIATYGSLGTAVDAYSGERVAQLKAPTYAQLIQGSEVSNRAAQALGGRFSPEVIHSAVNARISAAMPMLVVTATASTPDDAVRILATVEQVFQQYVAQLEQPGRDGSLTGVNLTNDPPSVARVGDPLTSAALAGLCGLVIGISLALYRDRTDQIIRNAGQIARTGLPYLGMIAMPGGRRQARTQDGIFRRIAVQCALNGQRRVPDQVLVTGIDTTSKVPSSHIAGGLAAGFTAYGRTVTLVHACGSNGPESESCNEKGLSDILIGASQWADSAQETEIRRLSEVAIGSQPQDIDALIVQRTLGGHPTVFDTGSDHTVVAGPVISSPSAIALAANVRSCLLVVTYQRSKCDELAEAVHILRGLGVEVIGVVAVTRRQRMFLADTHPVAPDLAERPLAETDPAETAAAVR